MTSLETSPNLIDDAEQTVVLCDACRHPMEQHDATGLRYCAATLDAAITRGCICKTI